MTVNTETLEAQMPEEEVASGHDAKRGGMDPALLGMMLFIASEVMFFAALFAAYFNARATLPVFPPEGFEFINAFEWPFIPIAMTAILLTSSVTMQWATSRIRKGDRTGMNRGIALTLILGITFLGLWLTEYALLLNEHHFGINDGIYGTLFYTLTGFHGAHVIGGVIGLAVILSRGVAGQFTKSHHVAVEAVHYYWHFVDVVWVLLFLTIYLIK
jgi:cytochrome c oxidase subunit 3